MLNNVITTNEVGNDEYWAYADSVYCTTCHSCGTLGCKCWGGCDAMYCKYGDNLIERYEEEQKDINKFYLMLIELGVKDPYEVTLEQIKEISEKTYPFIEDHGTIALAVSYYLEEK